jgi:hypothetical protein
VTAVSGSIVTVKFEVNAGPITLPPVTIPVAGPEYIRYPIQVGCQGFTVSADVYIGNITGLGPATAPSLAPPGNLSALVFFPIGNKNFSATDDTNAVVIYGPDGVILRDLGKKNTLTISPTQVTLTQTAGGFVITVPAGQAVTINGNLIVTGTTTLDSNLQLNGSIQSESGGTYAGNIATSGNVTALAGTAGSVGLSTHTHTQGDDSHGDTEVPTASPTGGT